jgi:hypothetical protein
MNCTVRRGAACVFRGREEGSRELVRREGPPDLLVARSEEEELWVLRVEEEDSRLGRGGVDEREEEEEASLEKEEVEDKLLLLFEKAEGLGRRG